MISTKMLEWFSARQITRSTVEEFKLDAGEVFIPEEASLQNVIVFPYLDKATNTVVNSKHLSCKGNYNFHTDTMLLWNYSGVNEHGALYICYDEIGVMTLKECGINACCIPNYRDPDGFAKIKDIEKIAQNAKSIILVFDKNEMGVKREQYYSRKFEYSKNYSVSFLDNCSTINDVLRKHGKQAVLDCIERKNILPVHGLHSFGEFMSEIEQYYMNHAEELFSTGFKELDNHWKLKKGELTVVTGIPGSGKTQIIEQLMINTVRQNQWKWCVYSPESYPVSLMFRNLAEKYCNKSWDGKFTKKISPDEVVSTIRVLDKYFKIVTHPDEQPTMQQIQDYCLLCCRKYGCDAIIIDPFAEVATDIRSYENETQYIGRILSEFRRFIRLNKLIGIIICHPTKLKRDESTGQYEIPTPYSISGSANWRNLADNCLTVWREWDNKDGEVTVFIQKIRNKSTGKLGQAKVYWDYKTGAFSETPIIRSFDRQAEEKLD